ncbi:hypothetical protein [Streptomyces bacillaris]|uniref:hypothetical protein n=1 Tax=Streptomyces bacillaris TaxID=68179 RepID=UPI00346090C1
MATVATAPSPPARHGAVKEICSRRGTALAIEARDETDARLVHEERDLPGILEDWEQARDLIEHFGAPAERFRPLWEQARHAALSAPALLPPRDDGEGARVE